VVDVKFAGPLAGDRVPGPQRRNTPGRMCEVFILARTDLADAESSPRRDPLATVLASLARACTATSAGWPAARPDFRGVHQPGGRRAV